MKEKEVGLFIFSIPTEMLGHIGRELKTRLNTIRRSLWYEVRRKHGCIPIDESVYLIPDESTVNKLRETADRFRGEFDKLGFDSVMLVTKVKGVETEIRDTLEISLLQIISSRISRMRGKKRMTYLFTKDSWKDLELARKMVGKFDINSERLNLQIEMLEKKLSDLSPKEQRKRKKKKWKGDI